jgi:hypothetical protein
MRHKLRWRERNEYEGEIIGPEHHEDGGDMVAIVCDASTLGSGHEAARQLVHRFNCYDEFLDVIVLALPFVEEQERDPIYKPGVVAAMVRKIRAAIAKAEGEVQS